MTTEMDECIKKVCDTRCDSWSEEVKLRMCSINALHADDAMNHRNCCRLFLESRCHRPGTESASCGLPVDRDMTDIYELLFEELESCCDKLFTLQDLHKKMMFMVGNENVYCEVILKKIVQALKGQVFLGKCL